MDMNKMMKNIFLFLFLAVVFACADDIIPEEGFIPMNPEDGTENSQENPYWAWWINSQVLYPSSCRAWKIRC